MRSSCAALLYVPNRARFPPPGVPPTAASFRRLRELGLRPASSCFEPLSIENGDLKRKRKSGDDSILFILRAGVGMGVFEGVPSPTAPIAFGGAVCAPRA